MVSTTDKFTDTKLLKDNYSFTIVVDIILYKVNKLFIMLQYLALLIILIKNGIHKESKLPFLEYCKYF